MPATVTALIIALAVVVPGAAATAAFELSNPPERMEAQERFIRFLMATAVLFPLLAPIGWIGWARVLHNPAPSQDGKRVFVNHLMSGGSPSPWWLLVVPMALVVIPVAVGWLLGTWLDRRATHRLASTASQAPTGRQRAWDYVFQSVPGPKLIATQLPDQTWVGGLFGPASYASPRRRAEWELYLETSVEVGPDGVPQFHADGTPKLGDDGLLLPRLNDSAVLRVFRT